VYFISRSPERDSSRYVPLAAVASPHFVAHARHGLIGLEYRHITILRIFDYPENFR
jgi:hypothetical protein